MTVFDLRSAPILARYPRPFGDCLDDLDSKWNITNDDAGVYQLAALTFAAHCIRRSETRPAEESLALLFDAYIPGVPAP